MQAQPVRRSAPLPDQRVKVLSPHRMYLLISFRKSTPSQNCQRILYHYSSKYRVEGFVGELTLSNSSIKTFCETQLRSTTPHVTGTCKAIGASPTYKANLGKTSQSRSDSGLDLSHFECDSLQNHFSVFLPTRHGRPRPTCKAGGASPRPVSRGPPRNTAACCSGLGVGDWGCGLGVWVYGFGFGGFGV